VCVRRHARPHLAATIGLTVLSLLNVRCSNPTGPSKTIIIPPPAVACAVAPLPVTTTLLARRYAAQGASRVDAFTFILSSDSNDCNPDPPAPATSGVVVINAGCLGAKASEPMTLTRFMNKIGTYHPDLVLLLIGVNDLDATSPGMSISAGVQGVHALIAAAHGIPVMVGTLLPQIAGDVHAKAVNLIAPFNSRLAPVAINGGARVLDLYSDIATDMTDWIAYDGRHPTEAGYQEISRVWFTSIRNAFELPPSSTVTTSGRVRPNTSARSGSRR
jgi:lysophospholipase L1-like esterase